MKTKILVVEDDPSILELAQTVFKKLGHQVITATSSEDAFVLARQERPDAIALDVMLPGMDGFTFAKKLKEHPLTKDIPIAFISAKNEPRDIMEGFSCGGAVYLTKPFTVTALKTTIESLLKAGPAGRGRK